MAESIDTAFENLFCGKYLLVSFSTYSSKTSDTGSKEKQGGWLRDSGSK